MSLPKILAVVGPTASGKTEVGVVLARAFDGEVIAADSRTIYKELEIGTAKPEGKTDSSFGMLDGDIKGSLFGDKPKLVEGIPHWGFDLVTPDQAYSVAEYQAYADKKIREILKRGKMPILVGGSGLYIRAVIDRLSFTEAAPDPALRLELATLSNEELFEQITELDPDALQLVDTSNRRRLERALEILRTTGMPLADSRVREPAKYNALQIGMSVEREQLYERIDERVDGMIAKGLVDEVRKLKDKYGVDSPAMSGIGYRQVNEFFEGKTPLREAVTRIKYDSHHYAKRQETWFKRDHRVVWVVNAKQALEAAQKFLES